jgi:dolichyl-phosphate beta-glucosyltransferase
MKICVVFPTKNQTAKLLKNLREKGLPYYDSLGVSYEFIIVTDGSDEANQKAMEAAMKDLPLQVRLLPYEATKGKGHNVKRGILAATGDYAMFMDADFATDLATLTPILPHLTDYDCWIGSRHRPGADIVEAQEPLRRFISWGSRKLIKARFHLTGITDTQCGYKIFRTPVAQALAKRQIIDGFAFDIEYLYFFSLNGFSIKEVPVKWTNDDDSTISHPIRTSLDFMKQMRLIKRNRRNYKLTAAEKAALAKKA